MRRAAGVRKPNEVKKRVLWRMKAAKDKGGEDFYDPERNDNFFGKK